MKERLLLAGLTFLAGFTIGETRSVQKTFQQGCEAIIIENPLVRGGLTLPLSIDGKTSIVFIQKPHMFPHELVHVEQVCRMGSLRFIKEYLVDPQKFEDEANKRIE